MHNLVLSDLYSVIVMSVNFSFLWTNQWWCWVMLHLWTGSQTALLKKNKNKKTTSLSQPFNYWISFWWEKCIGYSPYINSESHVSQICSIPHIFWYKGQGYLLPFSHYVLSPVIYVADFLLLANESLSQGFLMGARRSYSAESKSMANRSRERGKHRGNEEGKLCT